MSQLSNTIVNTLTKTEKVITSIEQLGFYKLLLSAKATFCFVILFISTMIVGFSAWALCKHYLDSSTFGGIVVTFGGVVATLCGTYNIVHGINDRHAMSLNANNNLPPNGTL
jgi:hypothetical protein